MSALKYRQLLDYVAGMREESAARNPTAFRLMRRTAEELRTLPNPFQQVEELRAERDRIQQELEALRVETSSRHPKSN